MAGALARQDRPPQNPRIGHSLLLLVLLHLCLDLPGGHKQEGRHTSEVHERRYQGKGRHMSAFAYDVFAGASGVDLDGTTATLGGTWSNLTSTDTGRIASSGNNTAYISHFGTTRNPTYQLSATP